MKQENVSDRLFTATDKGNMSGCIL